MNTLSMLLKPVTVTGSLQGGRRDLLHKTGVVFPSKSKSEFLRLVSDGVTWSENLVWKEETIQNISNRACLSTTEMVSVNQLADRIIAIFTDETFAVQKPKAGTKYVVGCTPGPKPMLVYLFYSETADQWAIGEIPLANLSVKKNQFFLLGQMAYFLDVVK